MQKPIKSLEEQYAAALLEGPVIVAVPGEEIHGFPDLEKAMLYVDAKNAAAGKRTGKVLHIPREVVPDFLAKLKEKKDGRL